MERGELAGVCLVDLSAAFDCLDVGLLLEKMEVMRFNLEVVEWFRSYLTDRQQCVQIEGSQSDFLSVNVGVPQGSILAPILYLVYTADLPEVIHDDNCQLGQNNTSRFHTTCPECGGVVTFADDTTVTVTDKDPGILSEKLSDSYVKIASYLTDNRLKVNDTKTHILVMTTSQKRRKNDISVQLITPSCIVQSSKSERLLGMEVHESMKWREYILDSKQSLISGLNTRVKALKKLRNVADFKTRLMIANGIFISKLLYCLPLYGGTEDYLLKSLQVVQNAAAREVSKKDRYTSTSV